MSVIDNMKATVKAVGSSRKEILYFASDSKTRVRFLSDLDEAMEFTFHSSWEKGIETICKEHLDMPCDFCNDQDFKTYQKYVFSVYDYESDSIKLIAVKATGITPIPSLIEFYETYGTITDRDYIIKKNGKGMSGSIVVTPCDKEEFNTRKYKAYKKNTVIDILGKAYVTDYASKNSKKKNVEEEKEERPKSVEELLNDADYQTLCEVAKNLGMKKSEVKNIEEDELGDYINEQFFADDILQAFEEVE